MNKNQNWLKDFPTDQNKPENFLKYCNRLDKNIIIDAFGKCTEHRHPICSGCKGTFNFNLKRGDRR